MKRFICGMVGLGLVVLAGTGLGAEASEPVGEPTLEMPTLHSLGVYWVVMGDDNRNATVRLEYRKAGTEAWRKAPPLLRVEKGAHKRPLKGQAAVETTVRVPEDAWLFAGSALLLEPQTQYELKVTLADPDGGGSERLLKQATRGEPVEPAGMRVMHVVPGAGGGTGSAEDPLKGIGAALAVAKPATLFLLHAGTYDGPVTLDKSGEPGRPIIWRGAGDGAAVIDGRVPVSEARGSALTANALHDVWLERLTVVNAHNGIRALGGERMVIRRCDLHEVNVGVFASEGHPKGYFVSDNVIRGALPFPLPPELWHKAQTVGVWIAGEGHDVCYNQVSNMEDTASIQGAPSVAIDVHHNDGFDLGDDGAEMDDGDRNVRNFLNRYTNSLCGISYQPLHGGPGYAFRNVHYNFRTEATKLHNGVSGAVMVHNTFVHGGPAWLIYSPAPVSNSLTRNNLFVGTDSSDGDKLTSIVDGMAIYLGTPISDCDFDYDGFSGFTGRRFMKVNGVDYATPEEAKAKSGIEKHLVMLDAATLFVKGQVPTRKADYDRAAAAKGSFGTLELNRYDPREIDLRLRPGCAAIGAGEVLEGFGDEPGSRPYLGAYAPGSELPWYGPRAEEK